MPDDRYFGEALTQAVAKGQVSEEVINDKYHRLLFPRIVALYSLHDVVIIS